jgi:hypothetical protein
VRARALCACQVDQCLICDRFDETVSQQIQRKARRAHVLARGHAFMDLGIGEGPIGADRAIVHQ